MNTKKALLTGIIIILITAGIPTGILGGLSINMPTVYAHDSLTDALTEEPMQAYSRDRAIYLSYLTSGEWQENFINKIHENYLEEMEITATSMFDFDGNGVYELWYEANTVYGYPSVSSVLTIESGKVKNILTCSTRGSTIERSDIRFFRDSNKEEDVIGLIEREDEIFGKSESYSFYNYSNAKLTSVKYFEKTTMLIDVDLSDNDDSADYGYEFNSAIESDYNGTKSHIYFIDKKQVSKETYQEQFSSYNADPSLDPYRLTCVLPEDPLPVPKPQHKNDDDNIDFRVDDPALNSLFSDISGHWAEKDIENLTLNGFVNGITDTIFDPESTITKEQLIKLIILTLNKPPEYGYYFGDEDESIFRDMDGSEWSYRYIWYAADIGIIDGGGSFEPSAEVSRETCALWIAKGLGLDLTGNQNTHFSDHSSFQYPGAVAAVMDAGIITGFEDNTFRPQEKLTRAQAVAILNRSYNFMLAHQTDDINDFEVRREKGDFDGDSKQDTAILFVPVQDLISSDRRFKGSCFLEINGKRSPLLEMYNGSLEINLTDIDITDGFIEMAITQFGEYYICKTDFFRYTGDNLYHMGEVQAVVITEDTEDDIIEGLKEGIHFQGDGTLSFTGFPYFVKPWDIMVQYQINKKGRLEIIEKPFYDALVKHSYTIKKDIQSEGDAEHPGLTLKAGETITFMGTDLEEWLYVKTESDQFGWIHVSGNDLDFAEAYFEAEESEFAI